MSKRKRRPDRFFKDRDLPPEVRRVIDQFAAEHGVELAKVALSFGETLANREFLGIVERLSPVQRSLMMVALADTMKILKRGARCDVCKRPAESFRFVCVDPEQMAGRMTHEIEGAHFTGFALLCGQCLQLPSRTVADTIVATARQLQAESGRPLGPRPGVIGVPVGEVGAGRCLPVQGWKLAKTAAK